MPNIEPKAQGLYDPRYEHDACGVGFIADLKNRKSHQIVQDALQILVNLEHRGACGCEANTGDGAGILIQMPHRFFVKLAPTIGQPLPALGDYGTGLVFLPQDPKDRERSASISLRRSSATKASGSLVGATCRRITPAWARPATPQRTGHPANIHRHGNRRFKRRARLRAQALCHPQAGGKLGGTLQPPPARHVLCAEPVLQDDDLQGHAQ